MLSEITAFNLSKVTGSKFDNREPLADIICNIMLEHFESEHFISITYFGGVSKSMLIKIRTIFEAFKAL